MAEEPQAPPTVITVTDWYLREILIELQALITEVRALSLAMARGDGAPASPAQADGPERGRGTDTETDAIRPTQSRRKPR